MVKMVVYILKRCWLIVLCTAVGFVGMYWFRNRNAVDTYTASGTMYVLNGNPNLVNYGYTDSYDLSSAVKLIDTYMIVIKSNKVMDVVAERLAPAYPDITADFIRGTLSMSSVDETAVVRVLCTTEIAQLSADICNAVMDVAPAEIIRVVSAGSIEVVDYATVPESPDSRSILRLGMLGGLAGAGGAILLLMYLFLIDHKVADTKEMAEKFAFPVLASIRRMKGRKESEPSAFVFGGSQFVNEQSENYARLRMNLFYMLSGQKRHSVVVTSSIPGEGKSTLSANLAISCALSGKHVLLIDSDLRRASQSDLFLYNSQLPGLSEVLAGEGEAAEKVLHTRWDRLDVLPAGKIPNNPAELMSGQRLENVLSWAEKQYDLVIIDMPPVNFVPDALIVSDDVAGCLLIVRQDYSDDREIRKALSAAEMTHMNVLGFVFYGEKIHPASYYHRKHYQDYYRSNPAPESGSDPVR